MAQKDASARLSCPNCGEPTVELELQQCMICRSLFCRRCAVRGYGREFCSVVCRGVFFHGDGEATEEDF